MTTSDAALTAPITPPAPRRGARLGAYTLWQLRDYAMNRGAPTVIVALLIGYLGVSAIFTRLDSPIGISEAMIQEYGSVAAARAAALHDLSVGFVASFGGTLAFLGALFAMNGIVSNDRKLGFYRFLFAKPVSPSAYYGTEFAVNGLGFLILASGLAAVYGFVVEPALNVSLLIALAAGYLCYAGLGFALSAISRWDWLSLVAVAGTTDVLWKVYGHSTSPLVKLLHLLPPMNRTSELYAAAARGLPLPWQNVLWLAGYGLVMFVAGLAILRHRRLAFN
jgi:hypothetical protein